MLAPSRQLVFRTFLSQGLQEGLLWPVWWYARGLSQVSRWLLQSVRESVKFFGVSVWVKNLFVPMYGDESIAGHLISFAVRSAVIVVRGLGVVAWFFAAILLFFLYVLAFPLVAIGFFTHLIGVFI
jgi:hypothetical protein